MPSAPWQKQQQHHHHKQKPKLASQLTCRFVSSGAWQTSNRTLTPASPSPPFEQHHARVNDDVLQNGRDIAHFLGPPRTDSTMWLACLLASQRILPKVGQTVATCYRFAFAAPSSVPGLLVDSKRRSKPSSSTAYSTQPRRYQLSPSRRYRLSFATTTSPPLPVTRTAASRGRRKPHFGSFVRGQFLKPNFCQPNPTKCDATNCKSVDQNIIKSKDRRDRAYILHSFYILPHACRFHFFEFAS
jgi:hypothetical protein